MKKGWEHARGLSVKWPVKRRHFRPLASFLLALLLAIGIHTPFPTAAQASVSQEQSSANGASAAMAQAPAATGWFSRLVAASPLKQVGPAVIPIIDIDQHWARDCISALAREGLVAPNAQGYFYPNEPITWKEYVGALNLLFPPGEAGGWANPLETALGLTESGSVVSNYPAYYFQPDRPLVRADAMMTLAAKMGAPYQIAANSLINTSLQDGAQVPEFSREGVAAALASGMVVNYPEANRLNPFRQITRGEAAALLCQAAPNGNLRRWIEPSWVAEAQLPETLPLPDRELRGVWLTNIDSQVLFSRAALEAGVNRLAELNFNTLYPTIWNWGFTLYPSQVAERNLGIRQYLFGDQSSPEEASASDRDMLAEAVELGHARGMAVIPWFEFGFMAPADYELYRRHPDWFTQKRVEPTAPEEPAIAPGNAAPIAIQDLLGNNSPEAAEEAITDPGIWMEGGVIPRRWMNPFHPQVQKFLLELIDEVMTNYEVDGFQFDDHLGLPVEFGYDPFTIALYRADHNGQAPPDDPQDEEWLAWRAAKISDFLAEVHKLVKNRRPNAVVSISPNPYPFAYVNYLQDWPTWVERGLVDELLIQVYRSDQNRFIWEMNKPQAQQALRRIPTVVGILSGLRARPVEVDHIAEQIAAVRDRNYSGMSFFFYESLWIPPATETLEQRVNTLQGAFSTPIPRPVQ
jgi:uncharacterized lipoprotein YddW (UPF0748 family)